MENTVQKSGPIRDTKGRLRGGNPGNKGGTGRPPSQIRALCAEKFYRHVGKAEAILCAQATTARDKLAALDLLGKYGGLQKVETETTHIHEYRERLDRVRLKLVG